MKALVLALLVPLALSAQNVQLAWDYPSNQVSADLVFRLQHATKLDGPWQVMTNMAGTNQSVKLQIDPGQHFFRINASNFWGESIYSNVTNTPNVPAPSTNLTIRRAD